MLRKLLSTPARSFLYTKQTAKLSELKQYVCLRESLNEEASQRASTEFQEIAKKYNFEPQELIELFTLVKSEPELLRKYTPYQTSNYLVEELNFAYQSSPFHISGKNLSGAIEELKTKYPEVVNFERNQSERIQGYETLENIFLRNGPKQKDINDAAAVKRFLPELEKRISGHIVELQNSAPKKNAATINQIASSLRSVYQKIQSHPADVYGKIRHFIVVNKGTSSELQAFESAPKTSRTSLEETAVSTRTTGEIADALTEGNDIPAIHEEQNKLLRKELGYNFLPWINDRKLIYEAQPDKANHYIYTILAGLAGSYLLYKLWQGDATNASLIAIFAVTAISFRQAKIHLARNSLDYLVQMNLHRDGRTLDLFIKRGTNKIDKIEGVPVSEFRIHRNDYTFNLPSTELHTLLVENKIVKPAVRISDVRSIGIGRGSWVGTYGDNVVLVPMNYSGNKAVLDNLFKGRNLEQLNA